MTATLMTPLHGDFAICDFIRFRSLCTYAVVNHKTQTLKTFKFETLVHNQRSTELLQDEQQI